MPTRRRIMSAVKPKLRIVAEDARQWTRTEALHSRRPFGCTQTHFDGAFVDAERRDVFGELQRGRNGGTGIDNLMPADKCRKR